MAEEEKKAILLLWLACSAAETDNSKHVLVGTTAIGTGINPQHVSLVVHLGRAYDMVSYVQESGCGGRNSQPAKAVMLVQEGVCLKEEKVDLYVKETVCRHVALSSYMDDMPVTCLSQPDFALCDLCQRHVGSDAKTPPKPNTSLDTPPKSNKPQHTYQHPQHKVTAVAPATSSANATFSPPSPSLHKRQQPQHSTTIMPSNPPLVAHNTCAELALSTEELLQKLKGQCSLCYLFGHWSSIDDDNAKHNFMSCKCWPEMEAHLPQWHEGQINATHIGKVKRLMRKDKPQGVACYTCFAPLHICNNSRSGPMQHCSLLYADIILPVVAVVLCHKEFREAICKELKVDCSDMPCFELDLCSAYNYKGERVAMAYAIFAVAMENAHML